MRCMQACMHADMQKYMHCFHGAILLTASPAPVRAARRTKSDIMQPSDTVHRTVRSLQGMTVQEPHFEQAAPLVGSLGLMLKSLMPALATLDYAILHPPGNVHQTILSSSFLLCKQGFTCDPQLCPSCHPPPEWRPFISFDKLEYANLIFNTTLGVCTPIKLCMICVLEFVALPGTKL